MAANTSTRVWPDPNLTEASPISLTVDETIVVTATIQTDYGLLLPNTGVELYAQQTARTLSGMTISIASATPQSIIYWVDQNRKESTSSTASHSITKTSQGSTQASETASTSTEATLTSSAPTGASTSQPTGTSRPSPQNNGLGDGAVAGVAVGCFIAGGLLAGLLLWFCWRRRRSHSQQSPQESDYALASHEKGFTTSTVPLAGPKQTSAAFGSELPQPLEDKAISADVSKISSAIKNHVQSYYHSDRVGLGLVDHDGLYALGSDLPISVGTLATLLSSPVTREIALRFIIAWVVVSRMEPSTGSTKSFLPTDLTQCYGKIMSGDRGFQTHPTLVAHWRVATSELMHSSYVRTPFSPSDDRHASIQAAIATLDRILQPYADAHMNDGERRRNLEELLKRSALFAFTLFSQPSEWEFEWQEEQGVTSGELCIFPALVQVADETGQPIYPPHSFSEAIPMPTLASMLPSAGLFLPETLHRADLATAAPTESEGTGMKYFQWRPKYQSRTSEDRRPSTAIPRDAPSDDLDEFPAIPTAYYYADYVLSSEKASSDTLAFVGVIQNVRQQIDEAKRLYLSAAVSNFLDAFPSKRTWIQESLQEMQRTLNDIGMDMDSAWDHDGDGGTVASRRKLEWGLKYQRKQLKKRTQLNHCLAQLTGAIHVMQTAELCGKPGAMAQEPIFEAPVRPWVPHDERDALRGPFSRQRVRLGHNSSSMSNLTLASETDKDEFETMSVNSVPVELEGSTPFDIDESQNRRTFLSPQLSREQFLERSGLSRRPRARSDYVRSTGPREVRSRASIDVVAPSSKLAETTIERNDSTASTKATIGVPVLTRRYRATSIDIQRHSEKHRSLPSELPIVHSQPSLIDELADYVLPSAASEKLASKEWPTSPNQSVPSIAVTSSPIGNELSAVPGRTSSGESISKPPSLLEATNNDNDVAQDEPESHGESFELIQQDSHPDKAKSLRISEDAAPNRSGSVEVARASSPLSYHSPAIHAPRMSSPPLNVTVFKDDEPVRRPSNQRPSQRIGSKRMLHASSNRPVAAVLSPTIETIAEPVDQSPTAAAWSFNTDQATTENIQSTSVPSPPAARTNIEQNIIRDAESAPLPVTSHMTVVEDVSHFIPTTSNQTLFELDADNDDDVVLSRLQQRLHSHAQTKLLAENLVRQNSAPQPTEPPTGTEQPLLAAPVLNEAAIQDAKKPKQEPKPESTLIPPPSRPAPAVPITAVEFESKPETVPTLIPARPMPPVPIVAVEAVASPVPSIESQGKGGEKKTMSAQAKRRAAHTRRMQLAFGDGAEA
ncbi:hypothetical protein TW65_03917 [Stemphylium lycopersici]|uniref:Uncharacterized protein n=1 Tax=Stemphylium lycopersici TaxID=183478 RepID=A0A364N0N2_STELY|nr:hypothetical protein TW65_03917 [Stemphylium lycopersici]RAR08196.1 hypothetical protein DDE83_006113 [Stemphylium lycopersici]